MLCAKHNIVLVSLLKHAASKKLVELRLPASFLSDGNDDSFVRPHGAMDDMVSICNDAVCCHKSRVSLIFFVYNDGNDGSR